MPTHQPLLRLALCLSCAASACTQGQAPVERGATATSARASQGDEIARDEITRDRRERMALQRAERDRVAQRNGEDPTAVMPAPISLEDAEITRRVLDAVASDASLADAAANVEITTHFSIVSLRGNVSSNAARSALDRHAREVVGASRVDNMLSVTAP